MSAMRYGYLDRRAFRIDDDRCLVWDDGGWKPAHPADAFECRLIDRATFTSMFGNLPDPPP